MQTGWRVGVLSLTFLVFSNTFIWRSRHIGCEFSIGPQEGDLLSFSQSFSIPGLPHTSEMPEIYSKTLSEIIRRSLKDNIKQTELREEVKLSRSLFSSGLVLSFSLILIFLSIHHDVLKYSSSFFWELFVLLFVNMTEEMCFSKAVC